ncbi:hypothetical protein [Bradyrhizobium sp. C9]|uniref:hypothetical protein n=1 Tax=Bradyrhizobium sp. C9 TaxID=142585 RepID=UPI000BE993CD|nr:hypothetical protein CO675_26905 [Bradyrhizobium sp. C9]
MPVDLALYRRRRGHLHQVAGGCFRVGEGSTGWTGFGQYPAMPSVFPDQPAPVVREGTYGREMAPMRWGKPSPPQYDGPPITNIRNVKSAQKRR